MDNFYLHFMDG